MSDEDFQRELENIDLSQPDGWADTPPDDDPPDPEPPPEKRKRVRASRAKPKAAAGDADLEAKLREPLLRIGEWLVRRDPELAQALREDAPKMARLLARWALNAKTPAGVVLGIRLVASALEPIDAFARVVRLTVFRLYDWRLAKREQAVNDYPDVPAGDFSGAEPPQGEPEPQLVIEDEFAEARARFAADSEPPDVS